MEAKASINQVRTRDGEASPPENMLSGLSELCETGGVLGKGSQQGRRFYLSSAKPVLPVAFREREWRGS